MKKYLIFITLTVFLALPCQALISSTELIDQAEKYDGQIIEYQGEVIGDVMLRGENGWVNVSDGKAALGIWAPKTMLKNIKITGGYRNIGDTVRIKGIFFRSSRDHGGDLMIEALDITIARPGHKIERRIQHNKLIVAGLLAIGLLALAIPKKVYRIFRK